MVMMTIIMMTMTMMNDDTDDGNDVRRCCLGICFVKIVETLNPTLFSTTSRTHVWPAMVGSLGCWDGGASRNHVWQQQQQQQPQRNSSNRSNSGSNNRNSSNSSNSSDSNEIIMGWCLWPAKALLEAYAPSAHELKPMMRVFPTQGFYQTKV